ncbi:MAG: NAD(P)H-dependent glycerol-3-phosphate dehydrogenase [Acidimicrobiales bacterium]|nr:NAD(P)H-dependent glycerol-3-phosphate dehydrogenase [Acidimicrobiales bacterium]
MHVAVLGGGSWGTTVAHLAAHNHPTCLWLRDAELAAHIDEHHQNPRYLPGHPLHPDIRATGDMAAALTDADVVVMGVPAQAYRAALEQVGEHIRPFTPIVSLAKGLEQGTRLRMSQVTAEVLPSHPAGVLTGPNLAKEIVAGDAAAAVIAMTDPALAQGLQGVFTTNWFRVYTNHDVAGCEVGGALKNVIALASGMADGLGTGDNTRAAVITRGLAEITRVGVAMGGDPTTFAGLAGMGDLLATCSSTQSRNRYVGEQLGRGRSIEDIVAEMDQVAEGVKTVPVVVELAREHDVEVPITEHVHRVLLGEQSAAEAYEGLLRRRMRHESEPTTEW